MDLRTQLQTFAGKYLVPAVTAGVCQGDALQVEAYGVCQRGLPAEVPPHGQWHIGSCAKSMTAALYARLVEQGAARWDAPIASLFADVTDIAPRWHDVDVQQLFYCLGGMPANPSKPAMLKGFKDPRPLVEQRTEAAQTALQKPPGTLGKFVYSNLGYMVVGAAIDRITGMPYEQALEHTLLQPLGITSLGFGPPPRIWGHKARWRLGSVGLFCGAPADPSSAYSDNPAMLSSAGTLHLGMADWAKFLRLFVTEGGGVLQAQSIETLLAIPDNPQARMSMGWASVKDLPGVSFAMQGSNTMWVATALLDAERQRASFMVCNDGRSRLLGASVNFAAQLLGGGAPETQSG